MEAVRQKSQEFTYPLRMTNAQNDMLELLAERTGRTRASLLREAVNLLIGTYRPVLKKADNDTESEQPQ